MVISANPKPQVPVRAFCWPFQGSTVIHEGSGAAFQRPSGAEENGGVPATGGCAPGYRPSALRA